MAIQELCRKHSVQQLFVFGSALSDKMTPESDIDMIVSFDSVELKSYADNYFDLKFALEDLFDREVDLLEEASNT